MWQIVGWQQRFEKSQSRRYDRLSWVAMPNKHDSDGFTTIIDHDHGVAHYGVWAVLVQVASKCNPRGTLIVNGEKPHTAESLARLTRIGVQIIKEAIPRFIEVGWMEDVTAPSVLRADAHNGMRHITGHNGTEQNVTRSFVLATDQTCVWEEARQRARDIKRSLWPARTAPLSERDRDMLLKLAYLSRAVLSEQWLSDGVEGTRQKDAKKPAAYLKTVLAETARRDGHNLNELMDSIAIPAKEAKREAAPTNLGDVGTIPT